MPKTEGTTVQAPFERVVDGDTIRVLLPPSNVSTPIRLTALDTEESNPGGTKPVTPWGIKTKEFTLQYFEGASTVTLEFPGTEPFEVALVKHKDNFGRLLAFVHKGDEDYQELAIEQGYSPYFMKYGHAPFAGHRARYERAERSAQRQARGLWDQVAVNGREMRNYAALGTWWRLRGELIEHFRALRAQDPTLYDTRLDYAELERKAAAGETVTVFSELRELTPTRGGDNTIVDIGSQEQPFKFFIPNSDVGPGREIVQLLLHRYVSQDETHPRPSYAFVTGPLQVFGGRPELVITSPDQITDVVEGRADLTGGAVRISELLPDPAGADRGAEAVTLRNAGASGVSVAGWSLRDSSGSVLDLSGEIGGGATLRIQLDAGQLPLNNTGDTVLLLDSAQRIVHEVSYGPGDVIEGSAIRF